MTGPRLEFGALCEGPFFFDAHLRADATSLRQRAVDVAPFHLKEFKGFEGDKFVSFLPVQENVASLKFQPDKDYVLAHGTEFARAICLSDDCQIESRLGRSGEPPNGTIDFAPVTEFKAEEADTLTDANWGRMRLNGDAEMVVELRRSLRVHAQDVAGALDAGTLTWTSISNDNLARLELFWQAQSARRGGLVQTSNAQKLGRLLAAHGTETPAGLPKQTLSILALAAQLEAVLEGVGQAVDDAEEAEIPLNTIDRQSHLDHINDLVARLATAASAGAITRSASEDGDGASDARPAADRGCGA